MFLRVILDNSIEGEGMLEIKYFGSSREGVGNIVVYYYYLKLRERSSLAFEEIVFSYIK